jgi:hypothetical protein
MIPRNFRSVYHCFGGTYCLNNIIFKHTVAFILHLPATNEHGAASDNTVALKSKYDEEHRAPSPYQGHFSFAGKNTALSRQETPIRGYSLTQVLLLKRKTWVDYPIEFEHVLINFNL